MTSLRTAGTVLALATAAAACGPAGGTMDEIQYVTNGLTVPTDGVLARDLGFDLNDDDRPDNQLGTLVGLLDLDLQALVTQYVQEGQFVLLHSLRAPDVTATASASWFVYRGDGGEAPDFTGAGEFAVSEDSPVDGHMSGSIQDGLLSAQADMMPFSLQVRPDVPVMHLHIVRPHFEAWVNEDGCTEGRIGGAISMWEVNDKILPVVAQLAQVPVDELRQNEVIKNVLGPDLDLIDGEGNVRVDADGEEDSISFGFGMTCARANFAIPSGDRPEE